MNTQPEICNICGGKVEYITNDKIYGQKYGSGYCYHCTNCGAYVGTHKERPKEALGLLADESMRKGKMMCHEIFDRQWRGKKDQAKERKIAYKKLATQMGIKEQDCHFGYFDLKMLQKAYKVLMRGEK